MYHMYVRIFAEPIPKEVNFAHENYIGYDYNGSVIITIVLDSPSSSDITVKVSSTKDLKISDSLATNESK